MKKVAFKGGLLIDGTGAEPVVNSLVLTEDDKIAFPYGKDVKEGAKTREVTLDQMYGS